MNHDEASHMGRDINHYETLCGPERIPFRAAMAFFAMGSHDILPRRLFAMGAFLRWLPWHFCKPGPSEMGVVAAQGSAQNS